MAHVLFIGIGNTLRRDDGAGVRAAELIAARYPSADVLTVHQLHPELAEAVAGARVVVFLDAAAGISDLTISTVAPAVPGDHPAGSHTHGPASLVGLAAALYGRVPHHAVLVQIPAADLGFGEGLSDAAAHQVERCVRGAERFLQMGSEGT